MLSQGIPTGNYSQRELHQTRQQRKTYTLREEKGQRLGSHSTGNTVGVGGLYLISSLRNMSKRKSKAIIVGKSDDKCKQCKGELVIKKHHQLTEKIKNQHYYFTQWDYCRKCNKVFFDERFRVANHTGQMLDEINRQNSFIESI